MPDLMRTEASERIDLGDWQHATDRSIDAFGRHAIEQVLTNPVGATRTWILEGFRMSNPTLQQIQVDRGVAILAYRDQGQTFFGAVTAEGDVNKIVDINSFSPGTYGIFIRFEYVDGDQQNRIFWNPSGLGSEFAQNIATRRKANWSVRIELTSPGGEWTQIGTVQRTGGAPILTDQRKLYFEGPTNSSYQSGWSTDGGGGANDRNADRQLFGVRDFQTFTAAMRQCVEDLKGRGLRRWWDQGIGGMNIGFNTNPVEDRLGIGDANFHLDHASPGASSTPFIAFDASNDRLLYSRSLNEFQFQVAGTVEAIVSAAGIEITNGLDVGFTTSTPVDDRLRVGDTAFYMDFGGGNPIVQWATGDLVQYNRTTNVFDFQIGSTSRMQLSSTSLGLGGAGSHPFHITTGWTGTLGGTAGDTLNVGRWDHLNPNVSFVQTYAHRQNTNATWQHASTYLHQGIDSTYMGFVRFSGDSVSAVHGRHVGFGVGAQGADPLMVLTTAGVFPYTNGGTDFGAPTVRWNSIYNRFLNVEFQTSATNTLQTAAQIAARSTGNMAEDFGGILKFVYGDDTATHEAMQIVWNRAGTDTRPEVLWTISTDALGGGTKPWAIMDLSQFGPMTFGLWDRNLYGRVSDWSWAISGPQGDVMLANGDPGNLDDVPSFTDIVYATLNGEHVFITADSGDTRFLISSGFTNGFSLNFDEGGLRMYGNGGGSFGSSTNREMTYDDTLGQWWFGSGGASSNFLGHLMGRSFGSGGVALGAYRSSNISTDDVFACYSFIGSVAETLVMIVEVDGDVRNATGVYGSISDERIKRDIKLLSDPTSMIPSIGRVFNTIKPIEYALISHDADSPGPQRFGFKASEVEAVLPKNVEPYSESQPDLKSVNLTGMIPILWEAVRQIMSRLEMLEA